MDTKNILIVCRAFYPDESPRSYRATELSKELIRQGHNVTIMCPEKKALREFLGNWGFNYLSLGQLSWKPIRLKSNNKYLYLLARLIRRFLSLAFEYPNIEMFFKVREKIRSIKGYDAVISIAVPYSVHWGVASVWKNNNLNNPASIWIADCGDPFFGSENDSFRLPFYWAWIEKWFMRKTDFITVPTSTSYLGYFAEFYSKIKVIPQGFKFEEYQYNFLNPNNSFPVFAYAGIFIPGKRDPTQFCEYLLTKEADFQFHIFSRDAYLIQKFVTEFPDKFIMHDFIPRRQLLEKLCAEVDFVVNFENSGSRQTPSKLIDYVLINKPILSVKSFDIDKENIDAFLNFDFDNSYKIADPNQYKIENVVSKFLKLLD